MFDFFYHSSGLPSFLSDVKYTDSETGQEYDNPWAGAKIDFENSVISRDIQTNLLKATGEDGTWSYNQYLYALEQENYCDFEVNMSIYYPIFNTVFYQ